MCGFPRGCHSCCGLCAWGSPALVRGTVSTGGLVTLLNTFEENITKHLKMGLFPHNSNAFSYKTVEAVEQPLVHFIYLDRRLILQMSFILHNSYQLYSNES